MPPQESQEENGAAADATLVDLDRLAGWLAHEVNNPIGGISNAFALIKDAIPSTHRHYKYVAAIEREIARVAALTLRVRQAYRYDPTRTGPRSLAGHLDDALRALEPLREARRVVVEAELDPAVAGQVLDGVVMGAAIRHLLQYGIESAAPDSTIRLTAVVSGDRIVLSVPSTVASDHSARAAVAGPPELARELTRRLVRSLGGELMVTDDHRDPGETRIGLPFIAHQQGS
jgi:signal transduction histidine kinase